MKTTKRERDEWRLIFDGSAACHGDLDPQKIVLTTQVSQALALGDLFRLLDDADRCAELEAENERLRKLEAHARSHECANWPTQEAWDLMRMAND